jgi:hypothetical protein
MAIESNVTRWAAPHEIPSINPIQYTDTWHLVAKLIRVHDKRAVDCWKQELRLVAQQFRLQPFSISDLQGGRGKVNPLSVWYTDKERRKELQEIHSRAGTSHLLEDYIKQFPLDA